MTHFAKIEDGIVIEVIVAEQDFIRNHTTGVWVQTSYNTRGGIHYGEDRKPDGGVALRFNYAGKGWTYDSDRDAFYAPKPFPSWVLNEATCLWVAPTAYPDDGDQYIWNEETTAWVAWEE
jgi:hypothetical protein|tara:strand:- start:76 stop:435 length:360 start_codon:yes stop_codon:yes gene_type:complete